jgi:heat shock protein HtpX
MLRNTLKTTALLAALGALFMGVGAILGGTGGLAIGLAIGLAFAGGSYWFSDTLAIKAARAQPVTREQAPQLYDIVEDLTRRAGMPMPRLYVSPERQPNAFATGRNEHHAAVCCTQGILQVLDEDELRGVLAHELSHVRNHDILVSSVAAAVALAIMFTARIAAFGAIFGGGGGRDGEGNVFGLLAMLILAPIAAMFVQMALSRSREYGADASGAHLLHDGEPLARALEKIEAYAKQVPMNVNPAEATAYIINPLTGRRVSFSGLFSTHPPTADRIARLRGGAW